MLENQSVWLIEDFFAFQYGTTLTRKTEFTKA
jgi:hypothetical protein